MLLKSFKQFFKKHAYQLSSFHLCFAFCLSFVFINYKPINVKFKIIYL